MNDIVTTEAAIHKMVDGYAADRDLVNQLLGQAQMASAFTDFSRTVRTSKLAYVKENKLYQSLKGQKLRTGSEFSGTWDEFCGLLGCSADKVDIDIANLRAFGEQALESMSKMGIGYRDFQKFRRLPEDSRNALINVARDGDKMALLDFAEELLAKQEAEKAKAEAALVEAREDLATKDERAAVREREVERLGKELRKAKRQQETATPDETAEDLRRHASSAALVVRSAIIAQGDDVSSLRTRAEALLAHGRETGIDQGVFLAGLFAEVERDLAALRADLGIEAVVAADATPEWLKAAKAAGEV